MAAYSKLFATAVAAVALSLCGSISLAQDIPTLRIPKLNQAPTIDGVIDTKEWSQAARITGFQQFDRRALTIEQLQPTWYIAYDDQNLYLAQYFPVYPKGTIKARMKQGDNGGQLPNSDEILGDDHVEIQICDLPTREQAVKQYFYKIMTNPYGALIDQRIEWSVGWMGLEWESQARTKVQTSDDGWTMEMAIPMKNLGHPKPIADNSQWFIQLVSASDSGFFYNAWQPVLFTMWDYMPGVVFDSKAPVFQLIGLGDVGHGNLDVQATIQSQAGQGPVEMTVRILDAAGKELYSQKQTAAADGTANPLRFAQQDLPLSEKGQKLELLAKQGDKIIYQAGMPFEKLTEAGLARFLETLKTGRAGAGQATVSSRYYHSYHKITADCDVDILKIDPKIRAAKIFRSRLEQNGKTVLSGETTIPQNGHGHVEIDTPKLSPGEYQVVSEIVGEDGKVLVTRTDPFVERSFGWEGNQLGKDKIVVDPFTPVEVNGATVKVWGRSLRFAHTGFPESIISKGQDLLASPIRLEGRIEGEDVALKSNGDPSFTNNAGYDAVLKADSQLGQHVNVTVNADTEYDGTTLYTLTLNPKDEARVERLDLVIPLSKLTDWEAVRSSGRDVPYGNVPAEDGVFWDSSRLASAGSIHGTFLPYCVLSDGERGLSWAADSDQDWILDDSKPSFFLEKAGDQVLMRARFVNTPSSLKRARTIRFMLTAMPTKPLPEEHRYRTWGTTNAPFGWMAGFQGSCMWAYGTGPTVSFYTQEQYDILKERLEQDRRRVRAGAETVPGPKYLPMSAWYVASNTMGYAMPEYDTYCGEWAGVTTPVPSPQESYINFKTEWGVWDTPRKQSRAYADLVPSTVDCRVYAYDQQQKQAGMNGYWWDHGRFWTSGDLIKGAAYVRDDGQVQGIYNISLMRDMMKRMAVCAQLNKQRPFHGYYSHGEIGPVGSYMQWLWAIEGPWYLNSSKVSLLDNIRGGLDGIRILLQTYQGLPITMRNETQDRDKDDAWQTRSCLGVGLLFDVGVGFEGGCVNEKARGKLLNDLTKFDYFNHLVEWTPYWRTGDLVKIEGSDVVATVYTRRIVGQVPGAMLVLFNKGEKETTATFSADGQKLVDTTDISAHDLENWSRDPLPLENGKWSGIKIPRHDFRLLLIGPRASTGN